MTTSVRLHSFGTPLRVPRFAGARRIIFLIFLISAIGIISGCGSKNGLMRQYSSDEGRPIVVGPATTEHRSPSKAEKKRLQRMQSRDYLLIERFGSLDKVDHALREKALLHRKGSESQLIASDQPAFNSIGPFNIGGRIRGVAFDPQDPNRIMLGGVTGGLWLSADRGGSWKDAAPVSGGSGIKQIVFRSIEPSKVYALVEEGCGSLAIRSVDRGVTWEKMLLPGEDTCMLAVPGTGTILAVGLNGIFRSIDDGRTWQPAIRPDGSVSGTLSRDDHAPGMSIYVDPFNANNMLVGTNQGEVWKSTDGGLNWTISGRLRVGAGARVVLSYARGKRGVVYANINHPYTDTSPPLRTRLFRSDNGGQAWTTVGDVYEDTDYGRGASNWNASYNNALWVDPLNENHILAGDVSLYRSVDGGRSWASVRGNHPDQHLLLEDPGYNGDTNNKVWVANDGGLYQIADVRRLTLTSSSIEFKKGYAITQIYDLAINPGSVIPIIAGSQDNSGMTYSGTPPTWNGACAGGDVFSTAHDLTGNGVYYGTGQSGSIYRYDPSGTPACKLIPNAGENTFETRIATDPIDGRLYALGAKSLFVTENPRAAAPTWRKIGAWDSTLTFAVASSDSNVIYLIPDRSLRIRNLHKTVNAKSDTPTWSVVNQVSSGARIIISPADPNDLMITSFQTGKDSIIRSRDGGMSWQSIGPSVPGGVYVVTEHPSFRGRLIAGTLAGLYYSEDGGNSWYANRDDGIGAYEVRDIKWWDAQTMYVGTYGKGVYEGAWGAINNLVVEFYHPELNHYFITASALEAASIDAGASGPNWTRTGLSFKSGGSSAVCRFYGTPGIGPNSHFFTVDAGECASVNRDPGWHFEGYDFHSQSPQNGVCPFGSQPVYRTYNGRATANDSNHRFTSSLSVHKTQLARGWVNEGIVMCAPL